MPVNDTVGYDIDAILDDLFDNVRAHEAAIQAQQNEDDVIAGPDGTSYAATSTKEFRKLQRQVRQLARLVKDLKRAVDGDVPDLDDGLSE